MESLEETPLTIKSIGTSVGEVTLDLGGIFIPSLKGNHKLILESLTPGMDTDDENIRDHNRNGK